jgi:hypothetical protein
MLPVILALHAATPALAQEPQEPQEPRERWAGHQVTVVRRKVPLLGTIETRQDVLMLADVVREGDAVRVIERPCTIAIHSGRAVTLSFEPEAVRRIPATTMLYRPDGDDLAATWTGGWGERDVDGDGEAGFLVDVDAPVCSGRMSVATTTSGSGTAVPAGGGLDGTVRITLDRRILDTSNMCLALVPRHSEETVDGWFRYRPVDAAATCDGLLREGWPVRAPDVPPAPTVARH